MSGNETPKHHMLRRGALEVLVIFIGILSAFWVEEYRDSRRVAADEVFYLERITADLDGGIAAMRAGIEWVDGRRSVGRLLLSYLETGESELSSAELVAASHEVSLVPISSQRRLGNRSTYDELLTTGNLTVLHDFDVRDTLGGYYLEYDRIGGRLEGWPREYINRHSGLVSPDFAEVLEQAYQACPPGGGCPPSLESTDEGRFLGGLAEDPVEAWRELSALVQYQDRQAADLRSFLATTLELRQQLGLD